MRSCKECSRALLPNHPLHTYMPCFLFSFILLLTWWIISDALRLSLHSILPLLSLSFSYSFCFLLHIRVGIIFPCAHLLFGYSRGNIFMSAESLYVSRQLYSDARVLKTTERIFFHCLCIFLYFSIFPWGAHYKYRGLTTCWSLAASHFFNPLFSPPLSCFLDGRRCNAPESLFTA